MDSRFPTHYLNDRRVLRASLPAFRQFVLGTAWSVSNMTDGFIGHEDLPLVQFSSPEHADELVKHGLWNEADGGWQIKDFAKHQTSAAQMEASSENRRERDRIRKQRDRKHERGDHSDCKPDKCPDAHHKRGTSVDSPRTLEGRGKAEAEAEADLAPDLEEVDLQTGEIDSTPISAPAPRVSDATSSEDGRISDRGKTPGPSELWPDDPPAKGVTTTDTPAGPRDPRPFDFNQFRNPNVNWSDAR